MLKQKRNAGLRAAEYVEDGMIVGLGTGSTAKHAIEKIGEMVDKEGIDILCIPTSKETEKLAKNLDISLTSLDEVKKIDLTIDGADEVDKDLNLIKGGGGALLREKMVADYTKFEIVIVDPSKMVDELGKDFDLPVEILPFWSKATKNRVKRLGCKPKLRKMKNKVYKTDNNNYILDCDFIKIDDPYDLSNQLNAIPGVIENGLFIDIADMIIIGKEEGYEEISID